MLFIAFSAEARAGSPVQKDSTRAIRFKLEAGAEYMVPYHRNRQVQTVSADVLLGIQFFRKVRLSLYAGVTTTYAWGNIIQWDNNFKDVVYLNAAFGAGPAFLIRAEPVISKHVSLSADIHGGLILYSSRFPYGGDIYNFMWRLGPSVIYRITDQYSITLGLRWMHVSNGQGLGPQNPSYESFGANVHFIRYFSGKKTAKSH
jgi:hypothetical protein